MYKCQICGSRTCPACLDCKSLGERKTGYYCNKYKVRLHGLAYSEQYSSTIELLHNGARACNQCIIDRGELLEVMTGTAVEIPEESDEEPFTLDERYYLRHTPPNPESRITAQDIRDTIAAFREPVNIPVEQVRTHLAGVANDGTTSTTTAAYSTANSSSTTASR